MAGTELPELQDINQLGRIFFKIIFLCGFMQLISVSKPKLLRDCKKRTLIFL